jgi:hypothetical protein
MRPARLDHTFFEDEPRSHLGALLLRKGLVSNTELRICFEDDIARVLGEQAQVEFADINVISVDHRAVALLPFELAEALRAIPIRLHPSGELSVAAVDPTDQSLLPQLKLATGHPIRLLVTTPSALRAAWKTAYNA